MSAHRLCLALATVLLCGHAVADEVILPQNRTAYFSSEHIELAVAGLLLQV